MIELNRISKTFHPGTPNEKTVIDNLSLSIAAGEFITIIGSNGAGKTTLFNLIAGHTFPSSGAIRIDGQDMTTTPEYQRARHIGRIFQDPLRGTAANMTIADNMMIASRKGFKWPVISLNSKRKAFFQERLKQLGMGLEDRIRENVSSLSGGQRQALTLLMMVLSEPSIVLLDEHTAALDPKNAAMVMDLTTRFIQEYGLTSLMITHNMQHAIDFGTRLLMMDDGEVVADVSGEEKADMTREALVDLFSQRRHKAFDNDRVLLSDNT